ncbi:hypothetical protein IAU59_003705 [Kwoniella sp. CBS 9459]
MSTARSAHWNDSITSVKAVYGLPPAIKTIHKQPPSTSAKLTDEKRKARPHHPLPPRNASTALTSAAAAAAAADPPTIGVKDILPSDVDAQLQSLGISILGLTKPKRRKIRKRITELLEQGVSLADVHLAADPILQVIGTLNETVESIPAPTDMPVDLMRYFDVPSPEPIGSSSRSTLTPNMATSFPDQPGKHHRCEVQAMILNLLLAQQEEMEHDTRLSRSPSPDGEDDDIGQHDRRDPAYQPTLQFGQVPNGPAKGYRLSIPVHGSTNKPSDRYFDCDKANGNQDQATPDRCSPLMDLFRNVLRRVRPAVLDQLPGVFSPAKGDSPRHAHAMNAGGIGTSPSASGGYSHLLNMATTGLMVAPLGKMLHHIVETRASGNRAQPQKFTNDINDLRVVIGEREREDHPLEQGKRDSRKGDEDVSGIDIDRVYRPRNRLVAVLYTRRDLESSTRNRQGTLAGSINTLGAKRSKEQEAHPGTGSTNHGGNSHETPFDDAMATNMAKNSVRVRHREDEETMGSSEGPDERERNRRKILDDGLEDGEISE